MRPSDQLQFVDGRNVNHQPYASRALSSGLRRRGSSRQMHLLSRVFPQWYAAFDNQGEKASSSIIGDRRKAKHLRKCNGQHACIAAAPRPSLSLHSLYDVNSYPPPNWYTINFRRASPRRSRSFPPAGWSWPWCTDHDMPVRQIGPVPHHARELGRAANTHEEKM